MKYEEQHINETSDVKRYEKMDIKIIKIYNYGKIGNKRPQNSW